MTAQNLSHPSITFQVNLELNRNESFGPKTNSSDVAPLHPDRHTTFIDDQQAVIQPDRKNHRVALVGANKSTATSRPLYFQNPAASNGMMLRHGDTFTVTGSKAMELRKLYVAGSWNDNAPQGGALLTITAASSDTLMNG